ncbi:hypothetical protein ZWY2020_040642 [Hordeum vulgare]|nr:hypothetical protein ZWY2020_040642 [Hordeum vulgare]
MVENESKFCVGDPKNVHLKQMDEAWENMHLFRADVLDYDTLTRALEGCEGVFHLATQVPEDKIVDPEAEVLAPALKGTSNVLKACSAMKVQKESSKFLPILKETSKSFKGKLLFVFVERDNEEVARLSQITGQETTVLAYTGNEDAKKFSSVVKYHWTTLRNLLKISWRTSSHHSTSLTQYLLDESKDALLDIYAPWCGHCQSLEPIYNKLSQITGQETTVLAYTGNEDAKKFSSVVKYHWTTLRNLLKISWRTSSHHSTSLTQYLLDESKDALLDIYAPWCGHCQSLEPIYNKLAKFLHGIDSLVITKMDGTNNEHPRAKEKRHKGCVVIIV